MQKRPPLPHEEARTKFYAGPKVHPRTMPNMSLQMLVQELARVPRGTGGSALVSAAAVGSPLVLEGAVLIRRALDVHRQRFLEFRRSTDQSRPKLESGDDHTTAKPASDALAAPSAAVYHDSHVVVLPDRYPKSAFHFLVMPRNEALASLNDLTRVHLPLLQHMGRVGEAIATAIQQTDPRRVGLADVDPDLDMGQAAEVEALAFSSPLPDGEDPVSVGELFTPRGLTPAEAAKIEAEHAELSRDSAWDNRPKFYHDRLPIGVRLRPSPRVKFLHGFHSLPSLPPLHMHVMSLDLLSHQIRHKKHYNSYTSGFFLASKSVVHDVQMNDRVTVNQEVQRLEKLEKRRMECVWCGLHLGSVPEMRRHFPVCAKNKALLT